MVCYYLFVSEMIGASKIIPMLVVRSAHPSAALLPSMRWQLGV